ncbi:MAG: hypothetical protein ACPGVY_13845 [Mycobacterium sp.]
MTCCETPTLYSETWRTARKTHWCIECRRHRIRPGDRYLDIDGLWDGRWNGFRQCARCATAFKAVLSESVEDCLEFGGLRNELRQRSRWRRQDRARKESTHA